MSENNSSEEVTKLFIKGGSGLASLGLAALSRYTFSGHINDLLGGSYNRSIAEHGLETLGLTVGFLAFYQTVETHIRGEKNSKENQQYLVFQKLLIVSYIAYIFLLVYHEIAQSSVFNRTFQWEQLIGSLAGIGLGWLAVSLVNTLFNLHPAVNQQDGEQ